jgi:hypothetical protein
MGHPAFFITNNEKILVQHGDILIFDGSQVMHAVQNIKKRKCESILIYNRINLQLRVYNTNYKRKTHQNIMEENSRKRSRYNLR